MLPQSIVIALELNAEYYDRQYCVTLLQSGDTTSYVIM